MSMFFLLKCNPQISHTGVALVRSSGLCLAFIHCMCELPPPTKSYSTHPWSSALIYDHWFNAIWEKKGEGEKRQAIPTVLERYANGALPRKCRWAPLSQHLGNRTRNAFSLHCTFKRGWSLLIVIFIILFLAIIDLLLYVLWYYHSPYTHIDFWGILMYNLKRLVFKHPNFKIIHFI